LGKTPPTLNKKIVTAYTRDVDQSELGKEKKCKHNRQTTNKHKDDLASGEERGNSGLTREGWSLHKNTGLIQVRRGHSMDESFYTLC